MRAQPAFQSPPKQITNWEMANAGQNVSYDIFGGGMVCAPLVLEASKSWIWSGPCPFPLRKMTGRGQTGEKRIIGETVFGEGFCGYVFPSREFSTLLCRSLNKKLF